MAEKMISEPRDFPAVEELLQIPELAENVSALPRPVATEVIRDSVASSKTRLQTSSKPLSWSAFLQTLNLSLIQRKSQEITRVINATGIVVHTNLGRAPISEAVLDAIKPILSHYSSLEFDLATGARGSRGIACERYLAVLSEAESGTVVNNCAAALFIILNTFAGRKKVIISRGELVQIGGGFRIPDILAKSGARLCEVGTTNITTLSDYEKEIDSGTGLLLKVHKSNFVQAGFTQEVPLRDLVALGKSHGLPVVNDLGSGVFIDTKETLGYSEPTVQQSVRAGADLTCFSGDKLLGGMQAGLIVGKSELITRLKKNPLFRALRADKIVFAILERLLSIYLNNTEITDIPLWKTLSIPESELYRRGKELLGKLGNLEGLSIEATKAFVGGGALPESDIPSVALVFAPSLKAERLMKRFREYSPPIIGRIQDNRFMLDLKAVSIDDLSTILEAVRTVLALRT